MNRVFRSVAVDTPIDRRDLLYPSPPFGVFQSEHVSQRPMEMKGDEGYLLIESREGVA
jgi:hypothetical protein